MEGLIGKKKMRPQNNILCAIVSICVLFSGYCGNAGADENPNTEMQITYPLVQGYNMVSFPFKAITSIENTDHINKVFFHYNPSTVSYDFAFADSPGTIEIGYGYFVYADSNTEITVSGVPSTQEQETFELKEGFNCFGFPYSKMRLWGLNQVVYKGQSYSVYRAIENGWLESTLFCFNPESQSYDFSFCNSCLNPKKAYLLYSAVDCTLVFEKDIIASLCGVVYDVSTCNPLKGVTISLGTVQDTTDSDGAYLLLNVPSGAHQVVLNAMGFDTYTETTNITSECVNVKNFTITPIAAIYGIIPE